MSCLSITVTPLQPAGLAAGPVAGAEVTVTPVPATTIAATPVPSAGLAVGLVESALNVVPSEPASLAIGEICTVSGGTLVVLAASDGPLRTRDGGYLLLDPEANPAEG